MWETVTKLFVFEDCACVCVCGCRSVGGWENGGCPIIVGGKIVLKKRKKRNEKSVWKVFLLTHYGMLKNSGGDTI